MLPQILAVLAIISAQSCLASLVTQGPWIVNSTTGVRVRLRCVNWYGAHQELFVVGGLELRSVSELTNSIKSTGANCVRIPYSIEMVKYNPVVPAHAIAGISQADLCNATARALDVMDCVVRHLQARGILIILNNHNSWGTWVGANAQKHDQGLWDLPGYSVEDWIQSLEALARRYRVAGFDLRNEIHDQDGKRITWGESQDLRTDWLAASTAAYERIRSIDPEPLAIVGGLCWNTDLRAMAKRVGPLRAFNDKKLVYTVHVYTFSFWWTENDDMVTRILTPALAAASVVALAASAACFALTHARQTAAQPGKHSYKQLEQQKQEPPAPIPAFAMILAILGTSLVFHAGWLALSASFSDVSRAAGCSTVAADAQWLVVASAVLVSISGLCLLCLPCVLHRLTCVFVLGCTCLWLGLLLLSLSLTGFYLSTDTAYHDSLGLWALQDRAVPVWVSEFGTGRPSEWKFRLIWDFIRNKYDLDFAYWAFNGRAWKYNEWGSEPFGLMDDEYSTWRLPGLMKDLFS